MKWYASHFYSPPERTFQVLTAQQTPLVVIWTKKSLLECFHIKIFNWKRKHSNSKLQDRCAYPTTTNIAFLCKMVRIPFYFPPERTFQVLNPQQKPLVVIWTKKSLLEGFHIKIFNWKRKHSNSKIQDRCAYPTTTNIALLCKMVRITFLFPTRKNLSGSDSPTKKPLVLIWTKK